MASRESIVAVERLFEALLRHGADPALLVRPDRVILRANPAACRAFQRSEAELQATPRKDLIVDDERLERLLREREQHSTAWGELLLRRADGSTFPVELTSTVLPMPSGEAVALTTFRDVSVQRQLEEALRKSEERFRVAFQTLPDAVTLTESETGVFVAVNEGATMVTGWHPDEMIGRGSEELRLWNDDDRQEFVTLLRRDGSLRNHRATLRRKDGSIIDVALSARPIEVDGRPLFLTMTRDITPQVVAERARDTYQEQLRHSQKLDAVGRLAGGVAHDFNNMLTVIMGCLAGLEDAFSGASLPPPLELGEITAAATRARDLTRQLLVFARRQVLSPVPLDLGELVSRLQGLLRRLLGEHVTLVLDRSGPLATVSCDPAQIEQAIVNLALNARDAMPHGGTLTIATTDVDLDEAGAAPFAGAPPGRYVRVAVQDQGVGMSRADLDRAFEPFFTTKPQGKGTGLGLATVHGCVSQSGGFVRIESHEGQGTTVEFILPVVAGPPMAVQDRLAEHSRGGNETILVVDDEPSVRGVLVRVLRRAGYRVLEASSGAQAVALAATAESIALLVCDVVMPDFNGDAVLEGVRRRKPDVRALFVSGYSHDALTTRGLLDPTIKLLQKPFVPSTLLTQVRSILDG